MFWSTTASAQSSSSSQRLDYDEGVPQAFICPISQEIMEYPMSVNCGEGHTFEKGEIENWMQRESTCPEDRHAITEIYPNRPLRNMIQEWKHEHSLEEIDSEQLAFYILFPEQIPGEAKEERHARLAAYLRFVQITRKTEDVAMEVVRISNAREIAIPDIHKKSRPHTLEERAWRILNGIVREANMQQSGRLSPRTARLMDGFEQMRIRSERSEEAMRDRFEQSNARIDQLVRYHEEEAARVREEAEARRRPLSKTEIGGAILNVVGPAAACAIGRGLGGICDTDPATTFLSEAGRFGSLDMIQTGLQTANLGYAWQTRGNEGVRRVNDNLLGNLGHSIMLGAREYESTLRQDARRIEREAAQHEQQELRDRLAAYESGMQAVDGRVDTVEERVSAAYDIGNKGYRLAEKLNEDLGDMGARVNEVEVRADAGYRFAEKLNEDLGGINTRVNAVEARADSGYKLAKKVNEDLGGIGTRVNAVEARAGEAYERGDAAQITCSQAINDNALQEEKLIELQEKFDNLNSRAIKWPCAIQ